jgi:hypothetical protein
LPTFKTSSRVDIFCVCSNLAAFKLYPCGMKGYMKAWKGTILTACTFRRICVASGCRYCI